MRLTVKALIKKLQKIEDQNLPVSVYIGNGDSQAFSVAVIKCEEPTDPNYGKAIDVTIFGN